MADDVQMMPAKDTHLTSVNVEEEMKNSYIDYAMSVIVARALPDARDGFKPVHRRVLFGMFKMKNTWNSKRMKSARVVGEVMGKYHPHGDSAIYDTLVRMAQWFSLRAPLVDGEGNFGTLDGDGAAAARYTECRMARIADEMLVDINKDTVDLMATYDGSNVEPRVLPAKLPNLLLNGAQGIAVGMATNIPPHNLRELCDGLIYFVDHPNATIDELMTFVQGPDFPTGAMVCGKKGIEEMYKLGRGSITMRSTARFEQTDRRDVIIITSIPYMVNKGSLMMKLAELMRDGVVKGISDIRDETSLDDGVRIVIELKQNADPAEVVLNQLYKHSELQTTFGANMIALDHGRPKRMTLRDFFQCYVDHRFDVHTRRARFDLRKAQERIHIVEGLLIAQDNLDEVIHIIRDSATNEEANTRLCARFGFSDAQVAAILEMRLKQLTGLERDKLLSEQSDLQNKINELKALLEDPAKIFAAIKQDLEELKAQYTKEGDRLTQIVPMPGEIDLRAITPNVPTVITLSHRGYVKRTKLSDYRAQARGGTGFTGVKIKDADFIERIYVPYAHDDLLFFTNTGRVYKKEAFSIPEASRTSFGLPIVNILEGLQKEERIVEILPINGFDEDRDVTFVLTDGTIKRTALADYRNVNRRGIIAINIEEGNAIVKIALTQPGDKVFMASREGLVNAFFIDEVRRVGRGAMGVCGMKFKIEGDRVCGFAVEAPETTLLFVTENGRGKRSAFEDFRVTHRGSKGVIGNPIGNERNGKLIGIATVKGDETMVLLTTTGIMMRTNVDEVRTMGRSAAGVNFIKLKGDATIASFSLAPADAEEETETEGVASDEATAPEAAADVAPEAAAPEATDTASTEQPEA